eukprot:g13085.t1
MCAQNEEVFFLKRRVAGDLIVPGSRAGCWDHRFSYERCCLKDDLPNCFDEDASLTKERKTNNACARAADEFESPECLFVDLASPNTPELAGDHVGSLLAGWRRLAASLRDAAPAELELVVPTALRPEPAQIEEISCAERAEIGGDRRGIDAFARLIFGADDAAASEYLKDLISSAGLKDAWAEMAKKFKSVQTQHAHLMSLASREGLDRDYVTRPEFRAIVQEEYKRVLQDHSKRLTDVEAQVQEEKQARLKLQQVVVKLAGHVEEELNELKPQVTDAHEWLKSLDERCEEEHEEVLKALKNQEEQLDQREETLRQEPTSTDLE